MWSKVSVDEVFMRYFQNRSSKGLFPDLHRGSVPGNRWETPNLPISEKNPADAHAIANCLLLWLIFKLKRVYKIFQFFIQ